MHGPDLRVDRLTGAVVAVAASRQDRPDRPAGCPFCVGGLESPEPYDVRAFPNRWPWLPGDRCEVVLYTADHRATFWSLGVTGARRVVDLWAERTAALGARPDVAYVLAFENRGVLVGATIDHPHGQIYAYPEVPPVPRDELARAAGPEGCALCTEEPGPRLVVEAGGWRAWVPEAATHPYGLVLAPLAHEPQLPGLDGTSRDGLATVLVDVLARLDHLWDEPMPYLLWVHQRPTDGGAWPSAHVHVEIAPPLRSPGTVRFVAAGELGSGVYINPVPPDEAAAALRRAAGP